MLAEILHGKMRGVKERGIAAHDPPDRGGVSGERRRTPRERFMTRPTEGE